MVPKGWTKYKVSELGTIFKGKGILKTEVIPSGEPCVRYGEIYTTYNNYFSKAVSFISKQTANESQSIEDGDILFAGSGETAEEIGKCTAYIGKQKIYAGGDIIVLRPKKSNSVFLSYILNSESVNKQKAVLGQGHSVVHIYGKDIANLEVYLPPFKEQNTFAKVLIDFNVAIEKLFQLITKKELKKKALMQKLLTGEVRFKGFGKNAWKEQTVQELLDSGYLIDHLDGNHGELYPKAEEFLASGVPYVAANNFLDGKVDFKTCKFLSKERANKFKKGISKSGDVLFAHNATVGPVALLETDLPFVILSTTATYYRCNNKKLLNNYLYQLLKSDYFVQQYKGVMGQSTRNQVPITMQRTFRILIPSPIEQSEIASVLTYLDSEIENLRNQLEKLQQQKKGLMQLLLTGKVRVKN